MSSSCPKSIAVFAGLESCSARVRIAPTISETAISGERNDLREISTHLAGLGIAGRAALLGHHQTVIPSTTIFFAI
jgi:hypothetical protein